MKNRRKENEVRVIEDKIVHNMTLYLNDCIGRMEMSHK